MTGGKPSRRIIPLMSSMVRVMIPYSGLPSIDCISCHSGLRRFPRGVLATRSFFGSCSFSMIGMSRGNGSSRAKSASSVKL